MKTIIIKVTDDHEIDKIQFFEGLSLAPIQIQDLALDDPDRLRLACYDESIRQSIRISGEVLDSRLARA